MPTMRSFTGFAGTPSIGSSYIGGANNVANTITSLTKAANDLQLGREKIAADMAQANMQAAAQQAALQSRALRDEQELRVKEQYQQSILGMKQRELDQAEQIVQIKTQEAAQQFQAQQGFQQEMATLTASGTDINEAFRQSALKYGPLMGGMPAAAYGDALKPQGGFQPGDAQEVPGAEGWKRVQESDNSWRYLAPAKVPADLEGQEAKPIPGAEGYVQLPGGRTVRVVESQELKDLRKKRDKMEAAHDEDDAGAKAVKTPDKELKGFQKKYKADYEAREKRLQSLEEIKSFGKKPAASATAPRTEDYEGKQIRNKRTNQLGHVIDGEFVPDEEE